MIKTIKLSKLPLRLLLCATGLVALVNSGAQAETHKVLYRGFQTPIRVNATEIAQQKNEWRANVVRIQIGDNETMDGLTGSAYVAMMDAEMAKFDALLPIFESNGIKVVFAMYSPPGGFVRIDGEREGPGRPAVHMMFGNPTLEAEYVQMWRRILEKYSANPNIIAFDLLNEPALNLSNRGWFKLVRSTVTELRKDYPTTDFMIKSVYGNIRNLVRLPLFNDPHIIYSYHLYPYIKYQKSGIEGNEVVQAQPSFNSVQNAIRNNLTRFLLNVKRSAMVGRAIYPPRINVGEFGISACAQGDPGEFTRAALDVLEERNGNTYRSIKLEVPQFNCNRADARSADATARRNFAICYRNFQRQRIRFATIAKRYRDVLIEHVNRLSSRDVRTQRSSIFSNVSLLREIQHESWTIHAFAEAPIWDPRATCPNLDADSLVLGTSSAVGDVFKEYMARNDS